MLKSAILEKLEALPESLKVEVLHYIEFLSERYAEKQVAPEPQQKKRQAGLLKGKIRMAEDFDEPIEDLCVSVVKPSQSPPQKNRTAAPETRNKSGAASKPT